MTCLYSYYSTGCSWEMWIFLTDLLPCFIWTHEPETTPDEKTFCLLQGQSWNKCREFSFPYSTVFIILVLSMLMKNASLLELAQRRSKFAGIKYKVMKLEGCKNMLLTSYSPGFKAETLCSSLWKKESVNVIVNKKTDPCFPLFHQFERLWELPLLLSH